MSCRALGIKYFFLLVFLAALVDQPIAHGHLNSLSSSSWSTIRTPLRAAKCALSRISAAHSRLDHAVLSFPHWPVLAEPPHIISQFPDSSLCLSRIALESFGRSAPWSAKRLDRCRPFGEPDHLVDGEHGSSFVLSPPAKKGRGPEAGRRGNI
jgi:hypothetical protein